MSLNLAAQAPPLREQDGALRVGRSRVSLETVLWAFQQGATPDAIVHQFPSLDLADVYDVVAYYLRNRESVDRYLGEQERRFREQAEQVRREFPTALTRAAMESRTRR